MRSASTSQSKMTSPEPVSASALRSASDTAPWPSPAPAKAFCMMVKPISITSSTRPPMRAGDTRSLENTPSTVKPAAVTHMDRMNQVGISITARS